MIFIIPIFIEIILIIYALKNKAKLKIIIPIIVVVALVSIIVICIIEKKSDNTTTSNTLELTNEMIEEIQENVENNNYFVYGVGYFQDYNKYVSSSVTSQKKTDMYTYSVYVKITYKDNYNATKIGKLVFRYTAIKDETSEKGYKIDYTVNKDSV